MRMPSAPRLLASALVLLGQPALAAPPGDSDAYLDETRGRWEETARAIWGFHELAASAVDLLRDPAAVRAAKEEFAKATGGQAYRSPLAPDAKPVVY